MLIDLAIGDAFGIAWEFVKPEHEGGLVNDGITYQQNPRYPELRPSQYTDDTLRSMATASVVLDGNPLDMVAYAEAIQRQHACDDRPGWSKRFQSYLDQMKGRPGREFIAGITQRRDTNGALMGCLPCGFLATPEEVKLAAAAQALCTHSSETVPFAQLLCLMVYHYRNGGGPDTIVDYLAQHGCALPEDFANPAPHWTRMDSRSTAHAVWHVCRSSVSQTERLKAAVDLRGDTDSVAALAMGITGVDPSASRDLSESLRDRLDDGRTGELAQLNLRLIQS